ncbi:MAG: phytanoyl-CoA dioxygenase family protein [Spirochaetaceae bacterium]|nr:phytanoyl-CoA dioxygenase family protein [Spirochaetaceae bacterium]
MLVEFQRKRMELPSARFGYLRDSTDALHDVAELRRRIAADGYLWIRGLIDRDAVLEARRGVLERLRERDALVAGTPLMEGVMPRAGRSIGVGRAAHRPEVLRVLEGPELESFYRRFYGEEPATFGFKWLRAVGNEQFTGSHMDVVYMGRGSERVNTVWIPFGDIPIAQGTLAVCDASHRLDSFARIRETYGRTDVDRDRTEGWFSEDPEEISDRFGGRWLTADVRAGDVVTFGLYTLHGSTTNTTNRFRISCDVRFQPASEPMDERWAGRSPGGHYASALVPMAQSRKRWGL